MFKYCQYSIGGHVVKNISRKIKKFIKCPSIFFRDYFLKNKPIIRNEIRCSEEEENILLRHDLELESMIPTNFPIDVVYTWVNNKDSCWKQKMENNKNDEISYAAYATDEARFSNHDELYYSVISVLENMPWVRKIFIVTDKQIPLWYEGNETSNIIIVDHKDIISTEYLPTFNSHVIEANLHKIENLSEHFIYFNDDVFVGRPLLPSHFFGRNGISSLFIAHKSLSVMRSRGAITPTLSASFNSKKILKEFGLDVDNPLVHTYVPLHKSTYEYLWSNYNEQIESFLGNKFRAEDDLNLATFLVPWMSYCLGKAYPKRDICYYFNVRSPSAADFYKTIKKASETKTMPHSFCANDFNSVENKKINNYEKRLQHMLSTHFSEDNRNIS